MQADRFADQLAADAALLESAVREAGALALSYYGRGAQSWSKDDDTPVSEADLKTDALLREKLRGARPDYGWVSEESEQEKAQRGDQRCWVVDPIDGTRAFLKDRPEWSISVALVEAGRPVLGAVFNPARDEFFFAARGGGAVLNGAALSVSARKELAGANVIAFAGGLHGRRWSIDWPHMTMSPVNSMAYRLCLVAAGRFDATISASGKSDWDIAAADLIVHEAGGLATSFDGAPFRYGGPGARQPNVVAASPHLHTQMLEHIARSWRA